MLRLYTSLTGRSEQSIWRYVDSFLLEGGIELRVRMQLPLLRWGGITGIIPETGGF